jgi:hydrogenase-1 operon protein HyaF
MSGLSSIPVIVESDGGAGASHGNALPILHEVRHALERLISTGESTQIDLNAIPFGPGDERRLTALLGTGEVRATVDALGPTTIQETAVPGVWLLDYHNAEGQRLALHIEITLIPDILRTQRADLDLAIAALDERLETASDTRRLTS